MNASPAPWQDVAAQLRPFLARRVAAADVDDVLQDVWLRVQRGLPGLRDEERFTSWLFQIARSAVAEHQRVRARHPLSDAPAEPDLAAEPTADDREAARSLARCGSIFVAGLPSPYREAVTLVELEGLTVREAAEMVGISVSGMKSRVQRGRAQLRRLFDAGRLAMSFEAELARAVGSPVELARRVRVCCNQGMRLSRACLVMVCASFALFAARPAGAMCGSPSTGFSPPPGTVLPASATVYLFVVKHGFEKESPAIRLEVDGARFTARRIAAMPRYDVVRVDLASLSREVVIRWKSEHAYDATEVRYPVGSPAPDDVHVTGVSDTHSAWSCSHTDTIDITLTGNAIAYRLDWSDGTSDVVPADLGVL